ncbi:MAG: DNA repair protein RadA [Elusimicrobia bacterium]|nr:DNA repair protein RadA [Elusimicrobiota bacterium]
MNKFKTIFRCQDCGYSAAKWQGRCPECGNWNSFAEEVEREFSKSESKSRILAEFSFEPARLSDAKAAGHASIPTGITELDRVLGGGIIKGQVTLLAGHPGVGKSTLMLELSKSISNGALKDSKILYVSGEESMNQIGARAERLGVKSDNIYVLSETNLAKIMDSFNKIKPGLMILDSIQTVFHPEFISSPGTVGQIRECAMELLKVCKANNTAMFILGHITKEGSLAGPKILEHIVDAVLYFDIEKNNVYRILRSYKNRFGPTSELGIFEMAETGLKSVTDASRILAETAAKPLIGRAFSMIIEGSRPILVEVQALVSPTYYPYPRRMTTGLDLNRAQVLIAAIEKNLRLKFHNADIFVSLQGGLKIKDPGLDLAFCAAVISSAKDIPLEPDWIFMGEMGILAQVSNIPMLGKRLIEADRLGFKKAFIPIIKKDLPQVEAVSPIQTEDLQSLYSKLTQK